MAGSSKIQDLRERFDQQQKSLSPLRNRPVDLRLKDDYTPSRTGSVQVAYNSPQWRGSHKRNAHRVPLPFNSSWHRGHTDSSLLGQHRDIPQVDENNMMRSGSSMLPAKHGRYSNIPWLTSHSNTLQSAADQSPAFFKKPNTDVTSPWKPLLHTSMPIDPYSKNPAQMKASYHKTVLIDTGMMPTDIKNKLQKNEKAQFESSFGCTGVLRSEDMTAPLPIQMAGHSFHRPRRNKDGGVNRTPLPHLGSTIQHSGNSVSRIAHCSKNDAALEPTQLPLMSLGNTPGKRWGWEGCGPRVDNRVLGPFPGAFGWNQGGRMTNDDLEICKREHREMMSTAHHVGGGEKNDQDKCIDHAIVQ